MFRILCLLSLFSALSGASTAGEFNKTLSVGDSAPAWDKLEGTDGKKHALADLKDKPIVVVIFTCNSCPAATLYEARILPIANRYASTDSKVAFVAINVNTIKEDQLPAMKERASKKKFTFPYLYDPSQEIARKFGAQYTPEFFVLDRDRKIAYMGALDDKTPPAMPTTNYLEAAINALLQGQKPATRETLARGCKIRFNKKDDE